MDTFDIEEYGNKHYIVPFLNIYWNCDVQKIPWCYGRPGDLLATSRVTGGKTIIEVKAEEKYTGNFFIETWSNKKINRRGWCYTIGEVDFLFYLFIDKKTIYRVEGDLFQRFVFSSHFLLFEEKMQKKYTQENDTWGRVVPISSIKRRIGHRSVVAEYCGEMQKYT